MLDTDLERFSAAMYALFKAFSKEADKDVTKVLFATLRHLDIQQAEYCIAQAIAKEPRFPIPKELLKYQHELPRKPLPKVEWKGQCNPKLAEHTSKLIEAILSGEFSREQIVTAMQRMEERYPGVGFREESLELVRYYNDHPQNMHGKPPNSQVEARRHNDP